jgi:enterochelin esterase family protein
VRSFATLIIAAALLAAAPRSEDVFRQAQAPTKDLASTLVEALGEEAISKGTAVLTNGGAFLFAVRSSDRPVIVIDERDQRAMSPVPGTPGLWFELARLDTGRTHNFHYLIDGKPFGGRNDVPAFSPYSYERPGVPKGKLTEKMVHTSNIYPGMKSDWWIYVPAQYDSAKPSPVMVWQDGEVLVKREEPSRAQIVFDNLTHEGKIPPVIHILISPGHVGEKRMRSIEYDTVNDTYTRFLLEEILPETAKLYKIRTDGYSRAIAGDSSGGICAFNAAWQKPDQFSRVLSRIGSFTSIQWRPGELDGGNIFPFLIRKQPKRNIRVWLQDGSGDLENAHGSWPMQNIAMANSLKMKEYDFHFEWGNGTHSRNGGHSELAEEMIWLWRDYDPSKTSQDFTMDAAEKDKPYFRVVELNRSN